ncbi:AI-2E family transporter [Idiomarina xiamenensis]|nr:AI-2E family transporter [Idiomarina xiamenensis]
MQQKLEQRSFLLMLVVVSLAFLWVLKPLWGAIFWAAVITVIFYPVHCRINQRIGQHPSIAAALTLMLCMVIVVIPVVAIISSFVSEGVQLYQRLSDGDISVGDMVDRVRQAFPFIGDILNQLGMDPATLKQRLSDGAVSVSQVLAKETFSIGQSTFSFFLNLGLMLYLSFFLLRDGPQLTRLLVQALPLGDDREEQLFTKFAEVTRATVKGNLVVAIVQGALGGLIFWILDLPAPTLWGVVMAALSLIPAIGAAIIWAPVAVYLMATGELMDGVILFAYGAVIISLADNVLRPILVGRDTKLPDYVVLFSTVGGLAIFGINGFVIGPLIAALFMVFWQIFMREFNTSAELTADERLAERLTDADEDLHERDQPIR